MSDTNLFDDKSRKAFDLMRQQKWAESWVVFDELIQQENPDVRGLNNALYAISDDNTGLGVQPERARKYLAAAQPWGPKNPAIFYTGACLWQELGKPDKVLEWVELALQHGLKQSKAMYDEQVFESLRGTPEFEAIFDRHAGPDLTDTDEGKRLLEFATDFGNAEIVEALKGALERPPQTVEEIGFYPGSDDTPGERCFRFVVSRLIDAELVVSVEDKYVMWVFEDFAEQVELPDSVTSLFAFALDDDAEGLAEGSEPADREELASKISGGYLAAMDDLESAYMQAGLRLRVIDTGGGNTRIFAAVSAVYDEKWCDVAVVETHDGDELGLTPVRWMDFAEDLTYATGLEIEP
jgi:hypothetical protein